MGSSKLAFTMVTSRLLVACVLLAAVSADFVGHNHRSSHNQASRRGRQDDGAVQGGIDFSGCQEDPETGLCCVEKEETVTSLEKEPILECTHKNVEQCHYTYVTQFTPSQEEVCEENFEKQCSITFKQQAYNETVKKCYKPVEKVCNGQGPEECRTVYESSCSTKYVEKQPGKFVGDTSCEKLPEEVCDLNPQKTCRYVTKLVPSLSPEHQCTIVPKETCILKFSQPEQVPQPLLTKWCLDPTEPAPGESYDESNALGEPLGAAESRLAPKVVQAPVTYTSAPSQYAAFARFR